jgi:hypothetical protein
MGKVAKVPPGETVQTLATVIHFEKGWWWKRAVNFVGALVTFIVLIVLLITKFLEGAWIVVVAVSLLIWLFRSVKAHYNHVAESLRMQYISSADLLDVADIAIVPIADIHRGTIRALRYARRISDHVQAVTVVTSPEEKTRLEERWKKYAEVTAGIELKIIEYDFRDVLSPLVDYIERVNTIEFPGQLTTVVIPEFVPRTMPAHLLHNQTANFLRFRLRGSPEIVVIDVPYHI